MRLQLGFLFPARDTYRFKFIIRREKERILKMIPEIQEELLRIQNALFRGKEKLSDQMVGELMVIQQTLSWVLDHRCYASPYDVVARKLTKSNIPYPVNPIAGIPVI